jgi:tetratricopeptide (TPR) repeat protein
VNLRFLLLASLLCCPCRILGRDDPERLAEVKKLYAAQRWEETANAARGRPDQPADFDYYRGMALARLLRWAEAREVFSEGAKKAPADPRFLTERAGAEYKLGDYREAKNDLRKALRLDRDPYIPEFLGTLYLLEGNLEAALRYWNRLEKPRLASLEAVPPSKTKKALVDRAVAYAPPAVLGLEAYLATDALLENLDVFPHVRTEIIPADDDAYKATLHLAERSGWGSSPLEGAMSLLRGLPYETVYPSYYGIRGEAVNFDSLLRWDKEKRRVGANLEFPLSGGPSRRLRVFFDARDENWNLAETFSGAAMLTDLNLTRVAGGAELHVVESGHWDWSTGLEGISREFRNAPPQTLPFFTDSRSLDAWLGVHRWLLRVPERRFTLEGAGEVRGGRNYASGLGGFGQLKGSLAARWLPRARGDDLEFLARVRAGLTAGEVPLDMLYALGVERDNELWLRGHPGTTEGRKGRAPLGRRYALFNSEMSKTVYEGAFFRVQLGPFLDGGAIADPSGLFGSGKWLIDAGLQARIRLFGGVSVVLSYGRDLRNGSEASYATSLR